MSLASSGPAGGAAIHPLGRLPHGHALVAAASGAVSDATRFASLIGAAFIAIGPVGTLLLPKAAASDGDLAGGDLGIGHQGTAGDDEIAASATSLPAGD